MIRSTPERLSFSYRLLLAFAFPLVIWVVVSCATILALQESLQSRETIAKTQHAILLANEYLAVMSKAREVERSYLITSGEGALTDHRDALARANMLHEQLELSCRDDVAQRERLELAGRNFQQWFHDVSTKRIQARARLPKAVVRSAQRAEQHLLAMLAEGVATPESISPDDAAGLRDDLRMLDDFQAAEGNRSEFAAMLRLLERGAPPATRDEVRNAVAALQPDLRRIIEFDAAIDLSVAQSDGQSLVQEFRESMTRFIEAEQKRLQQHQDAAMAAANDIRWIIWAGLGAGVVSILIVTAFIARRLRRSVESIDRVTDELAKGNWSARVAGNGRLDKLANRFNLMAELIEKRNRETKLLAELGETLHNCGDLKEALDVFGQFSEKLFPHQPGVLYMVEANGIDVSAVTTWNGGEAHTDRRMVVADCWGLRLARAHENGSNGTIRCDHVHRDGVDSRCIPLPAFGELIGMLFVTRSDDADLDRQANQEQQTQFTDTVAEQVALAFANVKLRETLRNQSIRDPLTQLHNRRHLDEVFQRELYRAERHEQPLSVLVLDIDSFKAFNDTHGHDGGDAVLKCIGDTLQEFFRPEDGVFRAGGEEFVTLLPGTAVEDAITRAEDLRKEIAALNVMHGNVQLPSVTISVGVASYPIDGKNAEHLLKSADRALYKAKADGRNCVVAAKDL